jgi:hypothetical protein
MVNVAVFYATSVLVTSLALAILITGASVAYAISQSLRWIRPAAQSSNESSA